MPNLFLFAAGPSLKIAGIAVAAGLLVFAAPARAGFQWVAPTESGMTPGAGLPPPVELAPIPGQGPEVISPVVIGEQTPSPLSSLPPLSPSPPSSPGMPYGSLGVLPLSETPAPSSTVSSVSAAPGETVHGFANNVPLAVALRQILPAGYGFSIDQDVDLGTLVSFRGGKPWRETLADTLQPLGLMTRERDQMVSIGRTPAGGMIAAPEIAAGPSPSVATPVSLSPMPASSPPPALEPLRPVSNLPSGAGPKPELIQPQIPHLSPPKALVNESVARAGSAFSAADIWTAERGNSLHKVLENWSRRAGIEFNWLAEYDYPLQASVSLSGTFEEAVRGLLSGFQEAYPQPVAELHNNPGMGHMVLVVQTRGNSYSN